MRRVPVFLTRNVLTHKDKCLRFERAIMPHLDAAYNLARWLMRNDADAEEAVQEAYLRAYRYFDGFRGEDGRAWLLAIVRNSCYTQHGRLPGSGASEEFDELVHSVDTDSAGGNGRGSRDPEALAITQADSDRVNRAIESLPLAFREVLVMREIEELSYKEIAKIIDIPLGTVMSRLARGRHLLQVSLTATEDHKEQLKWIAKARKN